MASTVNGFLRGSLHLVLGSFDAANYPKSSVPEWVLVTEGFSRTMTSGTCDGLSPVTFISELDD